MKLKLTIPLIGIMLLSGCGSADQEAMKSGLAKSGLDQSSASCYAEALAEVIEADIYNMIASNLNDGSTEKDAVNKARRKFGAEFKGALNQARKGCIN